MKTENQAIMCEVLLIFQYHDQKHVRVVERNNVVVMFY